MPASLSPTALARLHHRRPASPLPVRLFLRLLPRPLSPVRSGMASGWSCPAAGARGGCRLRADAAGGGGGVVRHVGPKADPPIGDATRSARVGQARARVAPSSAVRLAPERRSLRRCREHAQLLLVLVVARLRGPSPRWVLPSLVLRLWSRPGTAVTCSRKRPLAPRSERTAGEVVVMAHCHFSSLNEHHRPTNLALEPRPTTLLATSGTVA